MHEWIPVVSTATTTLVLHVSSTEVVVAQWRFALPAVIARRPYGKFTQTASRAAHRGRIAPLPRLPGYVGRHGSAHRLRHDALHRCQRDGLSVAGLYARRTAPAEPRDVVADDACAFECQRNERNRETSVHNGRRGRYRCKDGSLLPFDSSLCELRFEDAWIVVVIARDARDSIAAENAVRDSEARFRSLTALSSGEPEFDAGGGFKRYRGLSGDITKRKRAEEDLRRFRVAMDVSMDAILLTNPESMRYVDVNDAACRLLGCSREELLQKGPQDFSLKSAADLRRQYAALIAGSAASVVEEVTLRTGDGALLPVEFFRRAVPSAEGWVIVGIGRDISLRKQNEKSLRDYALQQEGIAVFGQLVLASVDFDESLNRAVSLVSTSPGAEFCKVLQLGNDGISLVLKAGKAGNPNGWASGLPQSPSIPRPAT